MNVKIWVKSKVIQKGEKWLEKIFETHCLVFDIPFPFANDLLCGVDLTSSG
jgi:hypothetical protein